MGRRYFNNDIVNAEAVSGKLEIRIYHGNPEDGKLWKGKIELAKGQYKGDSPEEIAQTIMAGKGLVKMSGPRVSASGEELKDGASRSHEFRRLTIAKAFDDTIGQTPADDDGKDKGKGKGKGKPRQEVADALASGNNGTAS